MNSYRMKNIERKDIDIFCQNATVDERVVSSVLQQYVYSDKQAWQRFLNLLFLALGVGFTLAGIIFFFAYNWANLDKFIKIGLIQFLVVAFVAVCLKAKQNQLIQQITLMGACVLVGVLFAVFGQIYQTGADSFDFFLGWTIFITIWVWVGNFPALWLFYILLINTTLGLYHQQVANEWSTSFICLLLTLTNASIVIFSIVNKNSTTPNWFRNTISIIAISQATIGIISGIFDSFDISFFALLVLTAVLYTLAVMYALRAKLNFYIATIPLSVIVIASTWLIDITESNSVLLLISLFIIVATTLTIRNLLTLQKKWANEKS